VTRIHPQRGVDPTLDGYREAEGHLPASIDDLSDSFHQLLWDYQHLQRRLETLPVIEQAKGLLIGRFGIHADTAFALLRRWSNQKNVKLRDLCRILVTAAAAQSRPATAQDPPPGPTLDAVLDWLTAATVSPDRSTPNGGRPA